jgi:DNA-binding response OmpR family regulator
MQSVILSIEDDRDVSEYIQHVLTNAGFIVHAAYDAPKGLSLAESVNPDLVLLDLHLPTVHGESVLTQLREMLPQVPEVILTVETDPRQVARSLNLGAEDYVSKPFSPEELIARVRARLRHHSNDQEVLQFADLSLNVTTHQVKRGEMEIELTPQEFKLLHFLMSHPNQVLSRDSILSRIWATSPDVETRVVDVYIGYLRKKIDHPFDQPLIHSVRSFGYMLKADQPSDADVAQSEQASAQPLDQA